MTTPVPSSLTLALSSDQREYVFHKIRVAVVSGPDAGRHVESTGRELTIGTEQGVDLVLADETVSRHHCTLSATSRGLHLRDLDSTNGTFVDRHRIESIYLAPGSQFAVGRTTLRVDVLDDEIREPIAAATRFGQVLGASPAMRRVFALLERVAPSEATILLEGETGTGKELLAEAVRDASPRADGPFVVIDCGAIPPSLIESELFGHMRGSFTGATSDRAGAFEAADGGTLFLDEVGELPVDMQPKLLRALEARTIKRIGATQHVKIDVRIVAATNRDLRAEVNQGGFRADLYYRLNTIRVRIPPLRERRDDIALLVQHFYSQLADDGAAGAPPELIAELCRHSWPGNVRELRSAVQRAVIVGDPAEWRELSLPTEVPALDGAFEYDFSVPFRVAKERATASWEKGYVSGLVRENLGNLSRAAREVKMDRNHLRELLRKYGVDKPSG